VTNEDFCWYLNDQNMGSVYWVSLANEGSTRVKSGDIITVILCGDIVQGATIRLTFKSYFSIVLIVE